MYNNEGNALKREREREREREIWKKEVRRRIWKVEEERVEMERSWYVKERCRRRRGMEEKARRR